MKQVRMYLMLMISIVFMTGLANAQTKVWVAPSSADAINNPFAGNADATKKGKKLFNQLCNICHGDRGRGDGMAGAALNPKPANFTTEKVQSQSDGVLFWKMTNGRTPMAAYKDILKEEERWQLVNYIRTFKK